MAKDKEKFLNKTTGEVQPEAIMNLLAVGRVQNEAEAKLVTDIFDRFDKMKRYRETSCPWDSLRTSTLVTDPDRTEGNQTQYETVSSNGGNSWEQRWRRDDELAMFKPARNAWSTGLPTVNVPVVYGAKQAITSQYQDQSISITIESQTGVDDIVAKIAEVKIKDIEVRSGLERMKKEIWFPSFVTRGTVITYNSYVCKKRKVQITKSLEDVLKEAGLDDDILDEPQYSPDGQPIDPEMLKQLFEFKKQEFTKKIQGNPAKYLLKEVEMTEYDDPYSEMVNLEDLYIDPYALDFNSLTRGARDVCWVQYLPANQVYQEYANSNDPFLIKKNITPDLIIGGNSVETFYSSESKDSLKNILGNISSTDNNDLACVVRYFNKETDKYIVLVNDIVVRDGVLPYNHKQLPFSKACMVNIPNCFYGAGLGVLLDQTQQDTEFFQSLQSFWAESRNNNPIVINGSNAYDEYKQVMEDGNPLKANRAIRIEQGESIKPIVVSSTTYDLDKVMAKLHENQVIIAGVNPQQNALPNPNLAVRSAQMSQESALLTIRSYIQNFEQLSVDRTKQWLSIIKQIEPTNSENIDESMESDFQDSQVEKQIEEYRKIKAPKGELEIEDENTGGKQGYDDIVMNPDLTKHFDKLDVYVRVEVNQLASRQLQAMQMQEAMTMVMNVRGNPAFKDDKLVNTMLKAYLDKSNMPTKVLSLISEEQNSESTELGELQNLVMEGGQPVPPIFGMSDKHKKQHSDKLIELFTQKRALENQMATLQPPQPTGDPIADQMAMQQVQMQSEPIIAEVDRLNKVIDLINQHLSGDMQRKEDSDIASVQMTMPPAPQGQEMPQPEAMSQDPMAGQEMPMNPMPQM